MNVDVDVVVVGGGPAGLATSRQLQLAGVEHVVLERTRAVGALWSSLYDGLTLHSGKVSLPDLPFPRGTPLFPTRDQFAAYLRAYRDRFDLPVDVGVEVRSVERDGDRFVVTRGASALRARAVVVATGVMGNPRIPSIPGRESFRGRTLHSIEYKRADDFAGRRVLVVGAGSSGADIAAATSRVAAKVVVSVRDGVAVYPRSVFGVPTQYWIAHVGSRLPEPAWNAIVGAFDALSSLAGGGPPALPPPASKDWALTHTPIFGLHLNDAVEAGRVVVAKGPREFVPDGMRFVDGSVEDFDDVVFATGFRPDLRVLGFPVTVDDHGAPVCVDARGRESPTGVRSVDDPDVFFVGYNHIPGGLFNIRKEAPVVARLLRQRRAR